MITFFRSLLAMSICVACLHASAAAQSEMTYKEYEDQLSQVQQREKSAKEEIAIEQGKVESNKQQIAELTQKLSDIQKEKLALLGITDADVAAIESDISAIKNDLDQLLAISPEDLAKRKKDIAVEESKVAAVKAKPAAYLWKIADEVKGLDQLVDQVKSRLQLAAAPVAAAPSEKQNTYTVKLDPQNRECLSRIAGYGNVFGDEAKWPYLYRANQSLIDKKYSSFKGRKGDACKYTRAADLIFPGQVLDIPR